MNVREIVKTYLEQNGHDGLCSNSCGCDKDDLFPCGNYPGGCKPAKKRICPGASKCKTPCDAGLKGSDCYYDPGQEQE